MEDYLETFAKGGPADHHLVMKSHPFEDGRERLEAAMKRCTARLGVSDRVVFLHGGKLGPLLDRALHWLVRGQCAASLRHRGPALAGARGGGESLGSPRGPHRAT